MQTLVQRLLPPHCVGCQGLVGQDFSLCPDCWRSVPFIHGNICALCGVSLLGAESDEVVHCDDCLHVARPWWQGRAALMYQDKARSLVLAFKHGDRLDLARSATEWMVKAARDILLPDQLVVPVPLHWRRLFKRRYNQAAVLATGIARRTGLECQPDLLQRPNPTPTLDGIGRDGRFAAMAGAIRVHKRHSGLLTGRHVLLIDDVMTSGATLAAASEACLAAGATEITILVLARVHKDT